MTGTRVATAAEPAPAGPWREVLLASRPLSWIDTALPFLAAGFEVERSLTPLLLLGTLYFLVPFNLLMYGVNDIYDYESDLANPRKRSLEGGLVPPDRRGAMWTAIAITNVPFLVAFVLLAPVPGTVAVLAAAAAALAYSAPPVRTKERPFADSLTSASHFVLPAVAGFLVAGLAPSQLPLLALAGFVLWAVASHALGAIQDIEYDRDAGIGSIATALGPRPTAALSLAGYGLAVVVAAAIGGLAVVAALALASYLLLPAAVLARPTERQARRAWRSFLGLDLLVGFVLTQLLLRHWGLVRLDPAEVAVAVAIGLPGLLLAMLLANAWALRRPRREAGETGGGAATETGGGAAGALPRLSVVIPARDEATRLAPLLVALASQDHPDLEIIVVDDASTDGTTDVAAAALATRRAAWSAPGAVLRAGPKPDGWAGKSWACAQGAGRATGTHIAFLDADTVPAPMALSTLHRIALTTRAGLVSGITAYTMPTWRERALVPGFPMTMLGLVPIWASRLAARWPGLAFAYGPLLLVERAAYEVSGGHAAVPATGREDVDLARTIAASGRAVVPVRAADLALTRHYPGGWGAARAWRRVALAYAGDSFATLLLLLAVGVAAWLLPPAVLVAGAATGDPRLVAGGLVATAVLLAFRLALAGLERQPLRSVAWHPVTAAVTLVAQAAGLADGVLGRPPIWRGRPGEG